MLSRFLRNVFLRDVTRRQYERLVSDGALRQYELATASEAAGKLQEAEAHYVEAIALDPLSSVLQYNLGLLLHGVGDLKGAEDCYQHALALNPDDQVIHSSLLCIGDFSIELTREEILNRHIAWARGFADPKTLLALPHKNVPDPRKRIRLGYVSADFRRHVTGRFIEPVLRYHDADKFEVYCYNNHEAEDDMTTHLRKISMHWRDIHDLDDVRVAERIRADGIDILIDLSGHSSGNRLLAFAHKPAPVQMTWMGYLNTTGLMAMDYRLTDDVADPAGVDGYYRERLLRLPQPQWCYVPQAGPISAPAHRPSVRPQDAHVTFGSLTRFMKVSDAAVDLWIRILRSSPGSRLCIIDVPDHSRGLSFQRRFAEAGLADRVDFLPTLRGDSYWQVFEKIDVALDSFPYTGATTTCDCLWMGLPVVTLSGKCGVSRSATSLLSALDLSDLIVSSPDEYVALACALATDTNRIAAFRAEIRDRMRNSVICDAPGFVRSLEMKLGFVWQEWCKVHA